MDESSLQTLWQEQPVDRAVPSELALKLTHEPVADVARPTSHFRQGAAAPKSRRPIWFAFGALAASVLALGVYSAQLKIRPPPALTGKDLRPSAVPTIDETIEELLAECRTYSNTEAGMTDWPRALTACNRVIELEPIHREGNDLVRRVAVLQACESDLETAKEFFAQGRVEDGLGRLARVHRGCEAYLLRALALAKEPVREVVKGAAAECRAYAKAGKWDVAHERCEVYARYACQTMEPDELYPPALMALKLEGPLNPRTEWRPKDPTFATFLRTREKLKLASGWRCPEMVALRPPPPPPDPSRLAKDEFARRFSVPEFGRALTSYFTGDFQSAPVPLQKVIEDMGKAQHHADAKALLLDINNAINLYENGNTELLNDRPDKAATVFLKALAIDERLVLGGVFVGEERKRQLDRRVSFVRKSIVESMSSTSYEKGKALADRKDFRAACRMWKLGANFSRSSIDLLKALTNVCTKRAQEAYDRAQSCEQLKASLDFAVDGDGFKEKIEESLVEEGCK